jgi:hypothetical protein
MTKRYPWYRFYSETINDRKIKRITRITGLPKMLVLGAWATLMALGNDSPTRGVLLVTEDMPLTADELQDEMDLADPAFEALMGAFEDHNMVHVEDGCYVVTNFLKRNFKSDHDGAERVRRHRAKQRSETLECNVTETLICNTPDTDTESESDTDQDHAPKTAAPTGAPRPPPITEGMRHYLEAFGRKRFATAVQKQALADCEQKVGTATFTEAVNWAARNNIRNTDSLIKAASNWGKGGNRNNGRGKRAVEEMAGATRLEPFPDQPALPP